MRVLLLAVCTFLLEEALAAPQLGIGASVGGGVGLQNEISLNAGVNANPASKAQSEANSDPPNLSAGIKADLNAETNGNETSNAQSEEISGDTETEIQTSKNRTESVKRNTMAKLTNRSKTKNYTTALNATSGIHLSPIVTSNLTERINTNSTAAVNTSDVPWSTNYQDTTDSHPRNGTSKQSSNSSMLRSNTSSKTNITNSSLNSRANVSSFDTESGSSAVDMKEIPRGVINSGFTNLTTRNTLSHRRVKVNSSSSSSSFTNTFSQENRRHTTGTAGGLNLQTNRLANFTTDQSTTPWTSNANTYTLGHYSQTPGITGGVNLHSSNEVNRTSNKTVSPGTQDIIANSVMADNRSEMSTENTQRENAAKAFTRESNVSTLTQTSNSPTSRSEGHLNPSASGINLNRLTQASNSASAASGSGLNVQASGGLTDNAHRTGSSSGSATNANSVIHTSAHNTQGITNTNTHSSTVASYNADAAPSASGINLNTLTQASNSPSAVTGSGLKVQASGGMTSNAHRAGSPSGSATNANSVINTPANVTPGFTSTNIRASNKGNSNSRSVPSANGINLNSLTHESNTPSVASGSGLNLQASGGLTGNSHRTGSPSGSATNANSVIHTSAHNTPRFANMNTHSSTVANSNAGTAPSASGINLNTLTHASNSPSAASGSGLNLHTSGGLTSNAQRAGPPSGSATNANSAINTFSHNTPGFANTNTYVSTLANSTSGATPSASSIDFDTFTQASNSPTAASGGLTGNAHRTGSPSGSATNANSVINTSMHNTPGFTNTNTHSSTVANFNAGTAPSASGINLNTLTQASNSASAASGSGLNEQASRGLTGNLQRAGSPSGSATNANSVINTSAHNTPGFANMNTHSSTVANSNSGAIPSASGINFDTLTQASNSPSAASGSVLNLLASGGLTGKAHRLGSLNARGTGANSLIHTSAHNPLGLMNSQGLSNANMNAVIGPSAGGIRVNSFSRESNGLSTAPLDLHSSGGLNSYSHGEITPSTIPLDANPLMHTSSLNGPAIANNNLHATTTPNSKPFVIPSNVASNTFLDYPSTSRLVNAQSHGGLQNNTNIPNLSVTGLLQQSESGILLNNNNQLSGSSLPNSQIDSISLTGVNADRNVGESTVTGQGNTAQSINSGLSQVINHEPLKPTISAITKLFPNQVPSSIPLDTNLTAHLTGHLITQEPFVNSSLDSVPHQRTVAIPVTADINARLFGSKATRNLPIVDATNTFLSFTPYTTSLSDLNAVNQEGSANVQPLPSNLGTQMFMARKNDVNKTLSSEKNNINVKLSSNSGVKEKQAQGSMNINSPRRVDSRMDTTEVPRSLASSRSTGNSNSSSSASLSADGENNSNKQTKTRSASATGGTSRSAQATDSDNWSLTNSENQISSTTNSTLTNAETSRGSVQNESLLASDLNSDMTSQIPFGQSAVSSGAFLPTALPQVIPNLETNVSSETTSPTPVNSSYYGTNYQQPTLTYVANAPASVTKVSDSSDVITGSLIPLNILENGVHAYPSTFSMNSEIHSPFPETSTNLSTWGPSTNSNINANGFSTFAPETIGQPSEGPNDSSAGTLVMNTNENENLQQEGISANDRNEIISNTGIADSNTLNSFLSAPSTPEANEMALSSNSYLQEARGLPHAYRSNENLAGSLSEYPNNLNTVPGTSSNPMPKESSVSYNTYPQETSSHSLNEKSEIPSRAIVNTHGSTTMPSDNLGPAISANSFIISDFPKNELSVSSKPNGISSGMSVLNSFTPDTFSQISGDNFPESRRIAAPLTANVVAPIASDSDSSTTSQYGDNRYSSTVGVDNNELTTMFGKTQEFDTKKNSVSPSAVPFGSSKNSQLNTNSFMANNVYNSGVNNDQGLHISVPYTLPDGVSNNFERITVPESSDHAMNNQITGSYNSPLISPFLSHYGSQNLFTNKTIEEIFEKRSKKSEIITPMSLPPSFSKFISSNYYPNANLAQNYQMNMVPQFSSQAFIPNPRLQNSMNMQMVNSPSDTFKTNNIRGLPNLVVQSIPETEVTMSMRNPKQIAYGINGQQMTNVNENNYGFYPSSNAANNHVQITPAVNTISALNTNAGSPSYSSILPERIASNNQLVWNTQPTQSVRGNMNSVVHATQSMVPDFQMSINDISSGRVQSQPVVRPAANSVRSQSEIHSTYDRAPHYMTSIPSGSFGLNTATSGALSNNIQPSITWPLTQRNTEFSTGSSAQSPNINSDASNSQRISSGVNGVSTGAIENQFQTTNNVRINYERNPLVSSSSGLSAEVNANLLPSDQQFTNQNVNSFGNLQTPNNLEPQYYQNAPTTTGINSQVTSPAVNSNIQSFTSVGNIAQMQARPNIPFHTPSQTINANSPNLQSSNTQSINVQTQARPIALLGPTTPTVPFVSGNVNSDVSINTETSRQPYFHPITQSSSVTPFRGSAGTKSEISSVVSNNNEAQVNLGTNDQTHSYSSVPLISPTTYGQVNGAVSGSLGANTQTTHPATQMLLNLPSRISTGTNSQISSVANSNSQASNAQGSRTQTHSSAATSQTFPTFSSGVNAAASSNIKANTLTSTQQSGLGASSGLSSEFNQNLSGGVNANSRTTTAGGLGTEGVISNQASAGLGLGLQLG